MKKKIISLILATVMILSLLPMSVLAAESDHSVKIQLTETTVSGSAAVQADWQIKTSGTAIKGASMCIVYDRDMFTLVKADGSDAGVTASKSDVTAAIVNKSTAFTIMNKMSAIADGTKGIVGIQVANMSADQSYSAYTTIESIYLKFNPGYSIANVTSSSIRWATSAEAAKITFSNCISVSEASSTYQVGNADSSKDSAALAAVSEIAPSGFAFAKPALTGTPTISGTAQVGQTLTAGVSGLSDTSNISYQWNANGTAIAGATAATYVLTATEAGRTVTVKVTASESSAYSGSVTSAATAAVANAAQAAPAFSAADITGTTDSTITVKSNSAWEYSKDNGANWQTGNVFTGLEPYTTYDQICVRLAAKPGYDASPKSAATSATTLKAQIADSAKGTLAGYSGTYDGSAHAAVTGAAAAGYTVEYSTVSAVSGFSATMPQVTDVADSKTVWVKLSKAGYEDKVFTVTATVSAKSLSGVTIMLGEQNKYSGYSQNVSINQVRDGSKVLALGTDYTITSGGTATNVETTTLTISGKGNYTGTASAMWSLAPKALTNSMLGTVSNATYTGSAITPKPAVTDGSALTEGTDFTYGYSNNTYAGTASVSVTGKGNYTGSASAVFLIAAADQIPATAAAANVTKGGNTLDLKTLVSNVKGGATVTYTISGTDLGCTVSDGVLTTGTATGTVKISVSIAAADVNGDGKNEYNAKNLSEAITVTIQDKATAALSGVSQSGCTYGETLADPSYTAPAGTTDTTITYSGTLRKDGSAYSSSTKPTEAGEYTVTVKCETADTVYTSAAVSFTIAPKSITGAAVTLGAALTYTGSSQTQTVSTVMLGGEDITAFCDISDNTATNAGTQNLTVTAKAASNYSGSVQKEFTVAKKAITPTIDVTGSYKFTGSGIAPTFTVKDGATVLAASDYTATVTDAVNAGTGTITVKASDSGNYSFSDAVKTFTIDKADALMLSAVNVSQKYTAASGEKQLENILPANAGTLSYVKGAESTTGSVSVTSWNVDAGGKVSYTLTGGAAGDTVTLPVVISSANYADTTANVVITLTEKDPQAALTLTGETTVVYGTTLTLGTSGGSGTGAVTYVVTAGTGDATVTGNVLTPTTAGTVTVKAVKAADDDYSEAESAAVEITITKAVPTGTPAYTAITTTGKTLADAALDVGSITPAGTIVWDLGDAEAVVANTAYDWTFTPADTTNYETLTGSIKPYVVYDVMPSSYKITVAEAENGSVSANTTSAVSGQTVTLTVKADKGYTLETLTVTDTSSKEIELTAVKVGETYTFKMPESAVTVKATFMEDNTMLSYFVDVKAADFFYDAVLWAAKSAITSGVDVLHFDPNGDTTRAQMVTFLWRAAGSPSVESDMTFIDVPADTWYTEAVRWAVSEGITNGTGEGKFSPDAAVSRAQAVTFLYRYSKSPAILDMTADGPATSPFADVAHSAYYYNAVLWAVSEGITNGTSENTFSPDNTCTRGEVVTFLYRCFEK